MSKVASGNYNLLSDIAETDTFPTCLLSLSRCLCNGFIGRGTNTLALLPIIISRWRKGRKGKKGEDHIYIPLCRSLKFYIKWICNNT